MLSQEIGQKNINKRLNRFSDILPCKCNVK